MKITLVTHYYETHRSGIEMVAMQLAHRMASGHHCQFDWFASYADGDVYADNSSIKRTPVRCLNFIEKFLGLPYPLWLHGYIKLNSSIQKCDLVWVHDYIYFSNIIAFVLAKLHHKPVCVTQHIGSVPYKNMVARALLSLMNRTLGCWVLNHADRVFFISKKVHNYYSEFCNGAKKAKVVPNGVDKDIFHYMAPQQRQLCKQALKFDAQRVNILFVGRFVERKGIEYIRQLANQLPDYQWHLLGRGPINPSKWNLPNVRHEFCDDPRRVAQFYQAVDLLILPSVGEGFPLVIQEALACGCPVLTTTDNNTGEDVHGAYLDVLAEPSSEGQLNQWVESIRQKLRTSIQQVDRERLSGYAQHIWSWSGATDKYIDCFERLLKSQHD